MAFFGNIFVAYLLLKCSYLVTHKAWLLYVRNNAKFLTCADSFLHKPAEASHSIMPASQRTILRMVNQFAQLVTEKQDLNLAIDIPSTLQTGGLEFSQQ